MHSSRSTRPPSGRQKRRHNPFEQLLDLAKKAGLRGPQQWGLARLLHRLGFRYRRAVCKGRRDLARLLDAVDVYQGKELGTNTRRRTHRFEELGLVRIRMGGRGKCGGKGYANFYYPGRLLLPEAITDRWMAEDEAAELETARRWEPDSTPPPTAPAVASRPASTRAP
jgi:hypothetical protein